MKKSLPTVREEDEGLGLETIMDPALAAEHGISYVHLAVFAIDVDRVRVEVEGEPEAESLWPFGFEVFLTEMHLLGLVDPESDTDLAMLEDAVTSVLELSADGPVLGAQLPFAVYDAVTRGALPQRLLPLFDVWKKKPDALVADLAPLWERPEVEAADLAEACLAVELEPPLAPPTRDALEAMFATFETDEEADLEPEGGSESEGT